MTLLLALPWLPGASAAPLWLVGTDPTDAPFEFVETDSQEPTGFDVELFRAVARARWWRPGCSVSWNRPWDRNGSGEHDSKKPARAQGLAGDRICGLRRGAQLSCLMSWSALKSTWTEGPMVEVTYRLRQ